MARIRGWAGERGHGWEAEGGLRLPLIVLVLVLLITGEDNQACYPIKYKI